MNGVLKKIGDAGLVPVVVIDDAELAAPTAKALMDGGLDVMEITMRTDQGINAIRNVKKAYPDMLIGAGTVLTLEKAKESVDAGAEFIVSPGLDTELVEWCQKENVAITPGVITPTDIQQALKYDLTILKVFPAGVYGGIKVCKALYGPYRMVKFIPTGGANKDNLGDYADKDFIQAIGGSWLCKAADINNKNFEKISRNVSESINILLGFDLAHIGINAENEKESIEAAEVFSDAFGFDLRKGNSSNFSGTGVEVNKSKGLGTMGHIAIRTNSIPRAVYYLGKKGYDFDWSTRKGTEQKTFTVYLKNEIGGFAVHLLQK